MKPSVNEARWMLFSDDELTELQKGLDAIELEGYNTTEGDMLYSEIAGALDERKTGSRSSGYNIYIRGEEG